MAFDDFVPIALGDLLDGLRAGGAGVVDKDVDRAELLLDLSDETLDVARRGDVGLDADAAALELHDLRFHGARLGRTVQVVNGDIDSGAGQRNRDRASDAAAGAGD